MAYLKRHRIGKATYIYIMQSVRKGHKVGSRILEYLGREDKIEPARLKRALAYWGVKGEAAGRRSGKPR